MDPNLIETWNRCRQALTHRLPPEDVESWLAPLRLSAFSPGRVAFTGVPNTFFLNHILRHHLTLLRQNLTQWFQPLGLVEPFRLELALGNGEEPAPADSIAAAPSRFDPPPGSARFTFQNFQATGDNHAAAALAQEAALFPGRYNPLMLVGDEGLGKTHLLMATAGLIRRNHPGAKIAVLSAEDFTNAVLEGIRSKRMEQLRQTFRNLDCLLMDGLEFLPVSVKAQEELTHTFDALHGKGRQLVLAGRQLPRSMRDLTEGLRSRLEMGVIAQLVPLDERGRTELVRNRAAEEGLKLPEEGLGLLARRIRGNPRQLEGVILKLVAFKSLYQKDFTLEFIQEQAAPYLESEESHGGLIPQDKVLEDVCDHFSISMKTLLGAGRTAHLSAIRRIAMYLLRHSSGLALKDIGQRFNHRTHSTVLHGLKLLEKDMAEDPGLKKLVMRLQAHLSQR
ncbi:MAG: DnaA/Hda family protein [Deltaproteobacteria bacterium]|nr:DnaA/Hda family protein [Deltaproteobacteria bacterium]